MLRFLLRYLRNNERFITKLSESRPMRRAAQLVVYVIARVNAGHRFPDNPQEFVTQLKNIANKYVGDMKKSIQNKKE